MLDGERYAFCVLIHSIGGYSTHADQPESAAPSPCSSATTAGLIRR
ncbi:MAG: hypothetical protein K9L82_05340 [Chromatiaceae bacterium]|nr:hypothetical protein [Chromatiaceae bacterium]MCF7994753.1 hypothetical protein [Chromatiaceae bacterium]MCF8014752.1 hypothetical protein [Chromatiaceae bacterium]